MSQQQQYRVLVLVNTFVSWLWWTRSCLFRWWWWWWWCLRLGGGERERVCVVVVVKAFVFVWGSVVVMVASVLGWWWTHLHLGGFTRSRLGGDRVWWPIFWFWNNFYWTLESQIIFLELNIFILFLDLDDRNGDTMYHRGIIIRIWF